MAGEILKLIFYLLAFFAVLWGAYAVSKWFASRSAVGFSSKFMRVIDRTPLTRDSSLCIIQVGERYFLTGVSDGEISLLSELYGEDLVAVQGAQDIVNPIDNVREALSGVVSKWADRRNNRHTAGNNDFYSIFKEEKENGDSVDKLINESREKIDRMKRRRSYEDDSDEE